MCGFLWLLDVLQLHAPAAIRLKVTPPIDADNYTKNPKRSNGKKKEALRGGLL
jgi:hypothetical protein